MDTTTEVQLALQKLIEIGRKSYKPEAQPTNAQCIGMAISRICDDPTFTMEIAAEHAEDWNLHCECKEIRNMIDLIRVGLN
jgi:hypothetical protein